MPSKTLMLQDDSVPCVRVRTAHLQFWQWSPRPPCSSWRRGPCARTCWRWDRPCHQRSPPPSGSSSSASGAPAQGCSEQQEHPAINTPHPFSYRAHTVLVFCSFNLSTLEFLDQGQKLLSSFSTKAVVISVASDLCVIFILQTLYHMWQF